MKEYINQQTDFIGIPASSLPKVSKFMLTTSNKCFYVAHFCPVKDFEDNAIPDALISIDDATYR